MNFNKSVLIGVSIIVLSACGGGNSTPVDNSTPTEKIAQLEASGAIPSLERGSDIGGTDDDSNGIRDDIDKYIEKEYSVALQSSAVLQAARAMQNALIVDKNDISSVKAVNIEISHATHCIYVQFDESNSIKTPAQVSKEIESVTTNTKERLLAYLEFSKALDGTSWALPGRDTCE